MPATVAYGTGTAHVSNDGSLDCRARVDSFAAAPSADRPAAKLGNQFTMESKQSAFHGVIPDPYKNLLLDPYDSQWYAFKRLLEGPLLSQQMILQSQQLQLLLQCPEQWCNVLAQPLSVFPQLTSIPTLTTTTQQLAPQIAVNHLSNGFLQASVKHEPVMYA
ncbi:unnamed protein product [Gongylonema pulchrum]|uniref:DBR1 domain-containing protein n=1 Tax=Gongylonema pulchrum TaxID=637853 RepID=A0A183DJ13_9BILA|nr:unnamed protein product [Gongylonema pulchrum]